MKIRSQNLSIGGGNIKGVPKKVKNFQERRAEFFFLYEVGADKRCFAG
jgi:hypothetical protein